MRVSDFDFELPPERIALRPARPRDSARLLVVFSLEVTLPSPLLSLVNSPWYMGVPDMPFPSGIGLAWVGQLALALAMSRPQMVRKPTR